MNYIANKFEQVWEGVWRVPKEEVSIGLGVPMWLRGWGGGCPQVNKFEQVWEGSKWPATDQRHHGQWSQCVTLITVWGYPWSHGKRLQRDRQTHNTENIIFLHCVVSGKKYDLNPHMSRSSTPKRHDSSLKTKIYFCLLIESLNSCISGLKWNSIGTLNECHKLKWHLQYEQQHKSQLLALCIYGVENAEKCSLLTWLGFLLAAYWISPLFLYNYCFLQDTQLFIHRGKYNTSKSISVPTLKKKGHFHSDFMIDKDWRDLRPVTIYVLSVWDLIIIIWIT